MAAPRGTVATSGTANLTNLGTGSVRSSRSRSARTRIGHDLVDVPTVVSGDPAGAVMVDPKVPEDKRFCSRCGQPVGRSKSGGRGRVEGFCGACRAPYSFVPKLRGGELVGGQYQVAGCLAHGGLGWIYLARDRNVDDRWVVLKGLLDSGSEDGMLAAVAEKRFLAAVQHGSIVEIHNFVSHDGAGYIVMEYVGGKSLKTILKERLRANNGQPDPLPVEQAIAYILGILPALGYLHSQGLVYCDMKPDNILQTGDDVKVIDLGGVRRVDDPTGAIYGTVGFQAPEIAELGPSVASDVFTVGRTLAVLVLDFRGYQGRYATSLPDAKDHPVLLEHESFYRFLVKSTAAEPADRFQGTQEMAEQLLGVLREIVARRELRPRPSVSPFFGTDVLSSQGLSGEADVAADWHHLPSLKVDPTDPAASFLLGAPTTDAARLVELIQTSVADGLVPETQETNLRLARGLLDVGDVEEARAALERAVAVDPRDWRVWWLQALCELAAGDGLRASDWLDALYTALPGELAPKLAAALASELADDVDRATRLYDVVSTVDPSSFTSAAFGLARSKERVGDPAGAVEAYGRVPRASTVWVEAQIDATKVLIRSSANAGQDALSQAAANVERLALDPRQRLDLERELLTAALGMLEAASAKAPAAVTPTLLGEPMDETSIRTALERSYRGLARYAASSAERIALVDAANAMRPRTFT